MLLLKDVPFKTDRKTKETGLFVFENDNSKLDFSIGISFKSNVFEGEPISPYLVIDSVETSIKAVEDLTRVKFKINNTQISDYREDTFYIYEQEPFEQYELSIVDIKDKMAYIKCSGTVGIYGYSNTCKSTKFELNSRIPIVIKR